jgi:hypothetical protein
MWKSEISGGAGNFTLMAEKEKLRVRLDLSIPCRTRIFLLTIPNYCEQNHTKDLGMIGQLKGHGRFLMDWYSQQQFFGT